MQRLQAEFGSQVVSIVETSGADQFRQAATMAKSKGAGILAVGGGDGTLGLAARCCLDLDMALGIIPTGTGNVLAHELAIPMDAVAAVNLLGTGVERRIDLGEASGTIFVTAASIGVSSRIPELLDPTRKSRFGRLAYIPAAFAALREIRPVTMEIQADGLKFKGRVTQLVVSSSRCHGGWFPTTESASIDDGKLSVYAVTTANRWALIRIAMYLLRGMQERLPEVWSVEATEVEVKLRRPRTFILDGDPQVKSRMTFRSLPRAIRVIVAP